MFEFFFYIPRLGCIKRKTASPLKGVATKRDKNQESIHTHIHSSQPLRHSLVLQERCNPTSLSRKFNHDHHRAGSHPGPPTGLRCFQRSPVRGARSPFVPRRKRCIAHALSIILSYQSYSSMHPDLSTTPSLPPSQFLFQHMLS